MVSNTDDRRQRQVEPEPKTPATPATPAAEPRSFFERYRIALIVGLLLLAALIAAFLFGWIGKSTAKDPSHLVLHGNVDLRQVELAFNNSERIAEVLVQEGDRIKGGQVLARLDTSRLRPQMASAQAEMEAQQAVVQRLHHGSRPEEISQAQATVASARADRNNAEQQWKRQVALAEITSGKASSQQDLDNARAAFEAAQAKLVVAEKSLELALRGPRQEDIAQAEAQLRGDQAKLELLRRQLADSELVAPRDAIVRSRLLESGEMVSPQKPVFNLAIVDPKWVRAYVSEPDLGKIRNGMKAAISADSFPGQSFAGWIGFISSVAEFTPKAVETEELRSSLVYEIRVFVQDPQDQLRLGMPATVTLDVQPPARERK
jgi:membrane fusion protein PltH